MAADYLPDAYSACDVLYSDPPWNRGYKTFAERCCIESPPTYDTFMWHMVDLIDRADLPTVLIIGKQAAKYFKEWTAAPTRLQRFESIAYYRNLKPIQAYTATGILEGLAKQFECVGDFCAGYGSAARTFVLAGKRFVASDCNPQCIAMLNRGLPRPRIPNA
jgi:hypothetical protein